MLRASTLVNGCLQLAALCTFLLMDCMVVTAPRTRMMLGVTLVWLLFEGIWLRGRYELPSEGEILVDDDSFYFGFIGQKTKQTLLLSFDWTMMLLIAGCVIATFRRPTHLAFLMRTEDLSGFLTRQAVQKREKARLAESRMLRYEPARRPSSLPQSAFVDISYALSEPLQRMLSGVGSSKTCSKSSEGGGVGRAVERHSAG